MRTALAAFSAALLACGVAHAGEVLTDLPPSGEQSLGVGVGVICNTTEQAQQYVQLRSGGAEVTPAMEKVNQAAQDPRACGLAAIAFQRDKTVETTNLQGRLVSIVKVNVLAGYNGQQWTRIPAMVQYAILESAGGIEI